MKQSLLRSNNNRIVIIETYFYCLEIGPTIGQSNELIANMINRIGINVLVFPERDYQSPLTRINRREYPTVKPINASFTGVCLSFDLENSPICTSISRNTFHSLLILYAKTILVLSMMETGKYHIF